MAQSSQRFTLLTRDIDGTGLIELTGSLDIASAARLSEAVDDAIRGAGPVLVIDLTQLEFLDSTGLAVLLNGLRRLEHVERRLLIVCPPGNVRRAFEITRLDLAFPLFDSVPEALDRARRPAA